MFWSPLSWHWQNFWTFARATEHNWMYEEGYSKKQPSKTNTSSRLFESDSLLFMLPVLSFLSKQWVCVRFVLKILFLSSLFQFSGFVCLLCFLLCSCSLVHFSCLINMDFLFHRLLRVTDPFSLEIHFSFPCFSSPAISYILQAVYSFFFLSFPAHVPWWGPPLPCTFPK